MPGRLITKTWRFDPSLDAPPKYRRACRYDAFLPEPLSSLILNLDARLAGLISEAESSLGSSMRLAAPP